MRVLYNFFENVLLLVYRNSYDFVVTFNDVSLFFIIDHVRQFFHTESMANTWSIVLN